MVQLILWHWLLNDCSVLLYLDIDQWMLDWMEATGGVQ
jgi:hypothetical protein